MKTTHVMTVALLVVGSGAALLVAQAQQKPQAQPPPPAQPGITRTDLQQHDLSVPGREVIQVTVAFAPGAAAAKHKHPGEEIVYAIEGEMEYQLEGKPPVTIKAGEVLFIPYGTPHAVKNVGKGHASELATYVVEKGKPLLVPVK